MDDNWKRSFDELLGISSRKIVELQNEIERLKDEQAYNPTRLIYRTIKRELNHKYKLEPLKQNQMEDAMTYEFFIRAAFNCGRYGVVGASSDIFSGLERAERNLQRAQEIEPIDIEDIKKAAQDFGHTCGQVTTIIRFSIEKFKNDENDNLNLEQKNILRRCDEELLDANSSQVIIEIIEKAFEIFHQRGRYNEFTS